MEKSKLEALLFIDRINKSNTSFRNNNYYITFNAPPCILCGDNTHVVSKLSGIGACCILHYDTES